MRDECAKNAENFAFAVKHVQQAALEELPLLLPKAAKSSGTLLLQIAHEKFNLQGDMGAVGRLASTDKGLILDLKGVI